MLSLLLAAATANMANEPSTRVAVKQPAIATVRIVRGAEIRFERGRTSDASILREAKVRERDGSIRSTSLIEFY
jgi:hypothetical protein